MFETITVFKTNALAASTPAGPPDLATLTDFSTKLVEKAIGYLPTVIGALFVLVVGLWLAGRLKRVVKAFFARNNRLDATLESFLSSLVYYAAVALVIVTTLGMFGVQTTSLAAIIGAAGLAIGLALQGTLGHVASGVMLLAFRPFSLGNYIQVAGHEGSVKAISLFTTELATADNKKVIIPNSEVWKDSIVNFSAYPTRRVDLTFGVSYGDDLSKVVSVVRAETQADDRIHRDPAPVIAVDSLGDSSVNIICRVWVDAANFLPVKWSLTQSVKERFDREGVAIPFPTRHIIQDPPREHNA
ncbi:MAG: mechanosensitive ion channel domain-containing protein [Pseudomonadota bacterium]